MYVDIYVRSYKTSYMWYVDATPGLSGGSGGVVWCGGRPREQTENTSFENNNRLSSQSENNISCSNNSYAAR